MDRKRIIVGVSGGIAAYKTCTLVRQLAESGHVVRVVHEDRAAFPERGDDMLVVDDLLADVDRRPVELESLLDRDDGPVDTGAVTPRRGQENPLLGGRRKGRHALNSTGRVTESWPRLVRHRTQRILEVSSLPHFLRYPGRMSRTDDPRYDAIRDALATAAKTPAPADALPHLRRAADQLTGLIDDTMARALVTALIAVPIVFALIGGFGTEIGPMVIAGIRAIAPPACCSCSRSSSDSRCLPWASAAQR